VYLCFCPQTRRPFDILKCFINLTKNLIIDNRTLIISYYVITVCPHIHYKQMYFHSEYLPTSFISRTYSTFRYSTFYYSWKNELIYVFEDPHKSCDMSFTSWQMCTRVTFVTSYELRTNCASLNVLKLYQNIVLNTIQNVQKRFSGISSRTQREAHRLAEY